MGVGLPEDLLAAVGLGIDLFDCVIPTRYARSATVFTARGRIRLTNRRYRRDAYPIDTSCDCHACAGGFSIHNLRFYQRLVQDARAAIVEDRFEAFQRAFLQAYGGGPG
jgi:queuine tRNA-ribosyltransferase